MAGLHPYLVPINRHFTLHAHAENAAGAAAYMLNQFPFFGIKTPLRRQLSREHYKQYPLHSLEELETIVKECFSLPQREFHYFGIELFAWNKRLWKPSSAKCMEECITTKSWWDSVDAITAHWLSPYFQSFPQKIPSLTSKWNRSSNIWLQRCSIMFQKPYKKDTDTELLTKYILHCANSKEFFIQKAIGWALREYSKTNPGWVKRFVKENKLPALSVREALKRL